jgi:hypothetical protein
MVYLPLWLVILFPLMLMAGFASWHFLQKRKARIKAYESKRSELFSEARTLEQKHHKSDERIGKMLMGLGNKLLNDAGSDEGIARSLISLGAEWPELTPKKGRDFEPLLFLNSVLDEVSEEVLGSGLDYKVEIDPGLPPELFGDSEGLQTLIREISSALIRVALPEGISWSISADSSAHAKCWIFFSALAADPDPDFTLPLVEGSIDPDEIWNTDPALLLAFHLISRMGGNCEAAWSPGESLEIAFTLPFQVN